MLAEIHARTDDDDESAVSAIFDHVQRRSNGALSPCTTDYGSTAHSIGQNAEFWSDSSSEAAIRTLGTLEAQLEVKVDGHTQSSRSREV